MKKHFAALMAVIFLVAAFKAPVLAEESLKVDIDGCAADQGELKVYLNHNKEGDFKPDSENVSVRFGAQDMTVSEILKFSETDESITYKCVVDVSGSMNQERIDLAKDMIKAIANKKKSGDNMSITAFGNDLIQSEYMTDPVRIAEKADVLTLTHDDTNLYRCIVEELRNLETSPDVHEKKCLIIFSDGAEDQATGITREEAEKATEESHIPIFTVALLKKGFKAADEESAKILGSFARLSSGGVHYAPDLNDGSSIDTIPESIVERLQNSLILREELQGIEVSGKEVVLKAEITANNGQTASDSINIPEGDVKLIQKEIEKLAPEEVSEDEVSEDRINEKPKEKLIFGYPARTVYIMAGILILLIILGGFLIYMMMRNRNREPENESPESEPQPDRDNEATIMGAGDGSQTIGIPGSSGPGAEGSRTIGMPGGSPTVGMASVGATVGLSSVGATVGLSSAAAPSGGLKVTLARLGKGETGTYSMNVGESFSVGRSASKAKLAFPEDTAMSGHHCTFSSQGKRLFIMDNNSTNGTFVNGVPVSGKHELEQDDTILMGSYEYRVSWK